MNIFDDLNSKEILMKRCMIGIAVALALAATGAVAQSGSMKAMDHSTMDKGSKAQAGHRAVGVVKRTDARAGTVSLAHEPVKSLNWPAMTMTFQVKDKALFDKLSEGRKVEVEFDQRGKDHVITRVK